MFFSNLLLPLLAVTSVSVSVEARATHGKQSTHLVRDFDHARRAAQLPVESRAPKVKRNSKGKRLVKKKKRAGCQVPIGLNATSPARPSSNTTAIGDNNWATPSATKAAASSSSVWATSASSSSVWAASASSSSVWEAASSSTPWAAASSTWAATPASSAVPSAQASSNSEWYLVETVAGSNFFDAWWFWQWDDPTHGTVEYVPEAQAWSEGLISINSKGNAIMKVDTTQNVSGGRKSVRIHGNRVWTGGMVIMDALHMPYGCGTWPAWWQNGPNWPIGGEIDIVEGINAFTENQVSLHTDNGCTMPSWSQSNQLGQYTTGNYDSFNCASYATSNQGCGVRDVNDNTSYGSGFNSVGGGVYALQWDKTGISVWYFPRASIPADITNDEPNPSGWGTPVANFPADSCSPYQFFYDNYNIFDTTFCGDWAGADSVWNYAGYGGQSQSCAAMTGYSTCSDYVLNQGSAFADAYWEVQYVKYYNSTTLV